MVFTRRLKGCCTSELSCVVTLRLTIAQITRAQVTMELERLLIHPTLWTASKQSKFLTLSQGNAARCFLWLVKIVVRFSNAAAIVLETH